jgi:hypothetical protein
MGAHSLSSPCAPTVVANRCTRWCTYTLLWVIDMEREEREEGTRREKRE